MSRQHSRMIRVEESVEESFDRNKIALSLGDQVDRLTTKQLKVALHAVIAGRSISRAIVYAMNHPKR